MQDEQKKNADENLEDLEDLEELPGTWHCRFKSWNLISEDMYFFS